MKHKLLFTLATLFAFVPLLAQDVNLVIATINGKPIYKSEIESAYKKNNLNGGNATTEMSEYVHSYIDYKLNIEEALAQKLDTFSNYKYQLNMSRSRLSMPYLQDETFDEKYISDLYNHMQNDVELNHILIPFNSKEILPSDTLVAYKKAIDIRRSLLKSGFEGYTGYMDNTTDPKMVMDIELQTGYIGWITAFMLSSVVEDAAYTMPLNTISMPIRSSKGYHILEILDRRAAAGFRKLDQVLLYYPSIPAEQHDIDSVTQLAMKMYKDLKKPSDFQDLCDAYTEVYETGDKGCGFETIGLNSNLPPSFISGAYKLQKKGDISEPIVTYFGVHVLRLVDEIKIGSFEAVRPNLMERLVKSDRSFLLNTGRREYIFEKYNLKINEKSYKRLTDAANELQPTDTSFVKKVKNVDGILFTIEDTAKYTVKEFTAYLATKVGVVDVAEEEDAVMDDASLANYFGGAPTNPYNLSTDKLKYLFVEFATQKMFGYLNSTLDVRFPDFKESMREYSEGLLLYDVKNANVWRKAQTDTSGLTDFFNRNRGSYKWSDPKYKGVVIHATNSDVLEQARTILANAPKGESVKRLIQSALNTTSTVVIVDTGVWGKGENAFVDNEVYSGAKPFMKKGFAAYFVDVNAINAPEEMGDVRAQVESDYQELLEKEWIYYLRGKYKVEINETLLNTIRK